MARTPLVYIQEFTAADVVSGAAFTGDSLEETSDGLVQVASHVGAGDIVGGLFQNGNAYRKLSSLLVRVSDGTGITVFITDGVHEHPVAVAAAPTLGLDMRGDWPLLPGWSVKVVATTSNGDNAVGAGGAQIVAVIDGWMNPNF